MTEKYKKITTRNQLKDYLNLEIKDNLLKHYLKQHYTQILIYYLRHMEYHYNLWNVSRKRNVWHMLLYVFYHTLWKRWSLKTGITLPQNVCGKGITLMHWGSIVVNSACHIGRNCCLINNINIGANGGEVEAPQIGDNVYIGPGAVLFGNITIADGCYIGANSVVTKSCYEKNAVLVGAPARIIKYEQKCWWEKNKWNREK